MRAYLLMQLHAVQTCTENNNILTEISAGKCLFKHAEKMQLKGKENMLERGGCRVLKLSVGLVWDAFRYYAGD